MLVKVLENVKSLHGLDVQQINQSIATYHAVCVLN